MIVMLKKQVKSTLANKGFYLHFCDTIQYL